MFLYCLNSNCKIFYIECKSKHNIILTKNDFELLQTIFNTENCIQFNENYFSESIFKLKNLQSEDLKIIFDLAVNTNKIDAFFIFPFYDNNCYCFNIFLITKNNFDLNNFLNLNFSIIKIESFLKINTNNINIDNLINLFNTSNKFFKNIFIPVEKYKKIKIGKSFIIPEIEKYMNLSNNAFFE
jgi:hypothetical protein